MTNMNIRIDSDIKEKADIFFNELGLTHPLEKGGSPLKYLSMMIFFFNA